ncbi:hypothetical protein [Clostridium baratii]|uniref:hypothetical protein n=1 Tax=Clostridium baratii TaxID=1561 RepID=UPI00242BC7D7|nr:hypothetical protein [Clostridium baratii]MBS6043942.1 hypothetical protein [Clostridium baratii]
MEREINRVCPYCGNKTKYETYRMEKAEYICYCDNDKCPVKHCTDLASLSMVYEKILDIVGAKE